MLKLVGAVGGSILLLAGMAQAAPGFYFGADAGWLRVNDDSRMNIANTDYCWWGGCPGYSLTGDGFVGGLHAGYNWQNSDWVFGVEGDIGWSGAEDTAHDFCAGGYCDLTTTVELRELITLRGRLGYDLGDFTPYITGGLAVGQVRNYLADNDDEGLWDNTDYRTGYIVGGGVEYAWTNRITVRVQGEYYDLGSETLLSKSILAVDGDSVRIKFKDDGAVVTAGVSYGFD
ncbi:MAG: outer membrane beta-barrel protein [Alphaproteobacteria bacterium]|nr:outer membrane beta-barrel protein [Alphaproteobacteria bacterium]